MTFMSRTYSDEPFNRIAEEAVRRMEEQEERRRQAVLFFVTLRHPVYPSRDTSIGFQ